MLRGFSRRTGVLVLAVCLTVSGAWATPQSSSTSKRSPFQFSCSGGLAALTLGTVLLAGWSYGLRTAREEEAISAKYFDAQDSTWGKLRPAEADSKIREMSEYPIGAIASRDILRAWVLKSDRYDKLAEGIPLHTPAAFYSYIGYHLKDDGSFNFLGLSIPNEHMEENASARYEFWIQRNRARVRDLSYQIFKDLYAEMYEAGEIGPDFKGDDLRKRFAAKSDKDRR